jgi:hypothetical protein
MSELYAPSDRCLSAKLVPTFADRGVLCSQRGGSPTAVATIFFQVARQLYSRLSGPRSRPTTSQKNPVVPGMKPGPLNLWPGTLSTRPQKTYFFYYSISICTIGPCCGL